MQGSGLSSARAMHVPALQRHGDTGGPHVVVVLRDSGQHSEDTSND